MIVGRGARAARVAQEAAKDVPAEGREFQSCPGTGQGMEFAAGQGEGVDHAEHSSLGFAGRSPLGPVVHRLTSTH